MTKERIFIQIDGSNFYHRLKELKFKNLLSLNYQKFAKSLLLSEDELILSKYYIGAIREQEENLKSKTLMANQIRLMNSLKMQGWQIGFGHMLKTDTYHEKGVDVLMAVDLLVGAYENIYDSVILVSSDTDLIPALEKIRSMKKKVEYIGFSHKPSYGLINHSDVRRLLTKEDVIPFLKHTEE